MRRSLHVLIAPGRKVAACVCLIAVLLLWSPLWAAAWQADGMTCCNGGMCSAHGQAKPDNPQTQPGVPSQWPSECEHHKTAEHSRGAMDCSVSCCHARGSSLAATVIFVLPAPMMIVYCVQTTHTDEQISSPGPLPSFEPPAPPPRTPLLSV